MPDLVHTPHGYFPEGGREDFGPETMRTDWMLVSTGSPAIDLHLKLADQPKTPGYSCLLAVGVVMDNMQYCEISAVKYVGGARVLTMA